MFRTKRKVDSVVNGAEAYSFSPELRKQYIEIVELLASRYDQEEGVLDSKTFRAYLARELSSDYIVKFIRDDVRPKYASEALGLIAISCFESSNYHAIKETSSFDINLNRMLNALKNLKYLPEKQLELLRAYSRCAHGQKHTMLRSEILLPEGSKKA